MTENSTFGAQDNYNMTDNYLVLSRKWRPQSFDEVVGQKHVTQTLQNALKQNRLGHGYLFTGLRGVGKTSVARILSRTVNCENQQDGVNPCNKCSICIDILKGNNFDVIELDGASNRGIDEIRDLREAVKYPPSSGTYKVYIIDEVHMLTKEAFNALLKTLEEPPKHVLFILATTDPHKIPQTILSRTQRFNFKRISIDEINSHLAKILSNENKTFEESCLELISKKSDGSIRDALSLLDQTIAYCDDVVDVKNVSEAIGLIDNSVYSQVLFFILESDLSNILLIVKESINSGHSINDFISGFIDFLNRCMHFQLDKTLDEHILFDEDTKEFLEKIKSNLSIELLISMLELTIQFQNKLKFINQPMIALETHFVQLAYIEKNNKTILNKNEIINQLSKKNINNEKKNDIVNSTKQGQKSNDNKINNTMPNKDLKPSTEDNNKNTNKDTVIKKKSNTITEKNDINVNNSNITVEDIELKWDTIIDEINDKNPKTASFLSEALISEFKDGQLVLKIINGSQFHINSLENDAQIINDVFSELLNQKMNVCFKIEKQKLSDNNESKPEQHPLLSKAIDMLDGEII